MFLLNLVPVVIYFYFCIIKSPFMNTGCALVSAGAWIEVTWFCFVCYCALCYFCFAKFNLTSYFAALIKNKIK